MTNGIFNLEKFRTEVTSRVNFVRAAQEEGRLGINYIRNKYSTSVPKRQVPSSLSDHHDEETHAHQLTSSPAGKGKSLKKLKTVDRQRSIPPASSFLTDDPHRAGRLQWVHPEKWYSLTPLSAQSSCEIDGIRYQYHKPRLPPRPSENPYSALPTRVLESVDKVETKPRRKKAASHDPQDSASSNKVRSPPPPPL
eukprot:768056-Hanusia_phi.AAC.7